MSVNKYLPHILVLPEDEADSDIANGFLLHPQLNDRSIQVLPYVGGWKVIDGLWGHDLLRHNKTELDRMICSIKPFLFSQSR